MEISSIIKAIEESSSFDELKSLGILPEPDIDESYYFVSYSHLDYKKVLLDIIGLQALGLKIWYDRGLETGKSWLSDVSRKISSFHNKASIVFLSSNFKASEACKKEAKEIKDAHKGVLLVDLDGSEKIDLGPQCIATEYGIPVEAKKNLLLSLPKPELFNFLIATGEDFPILKKPVAMITSLMDNNLSEVEVPPFLTKDGKEYPVGLIGRDAFANMQNLRKVSISDGWQMVLDDAFSNCPSLEKIEFGIPGKGTFGPNPMGVVLNAFMGCESIKSLDFIHVKPSKKASIVFRNAFVKSNLTSIELKGMPIFFEKYCFANSDYLEKVSVKQSCLLSDGEFMSCHNLKEVEVIGKVASNIIGESCFENCTSLEKVILPDSITKIESHAFKNCSSLKSIALPKDLLAMNENAFEGCSSLEEIHLGPHLTLLRGSFLGCSSIKRIIVDNIKAKCMELDYSLTPFEDMMLDLFPNLEEAYVKGDKRLSLDEFEEFESDKPGYRVYRRAR